MTLVDDVRADPAQIVRQHGRTQAAWTVPESSPLHAALTSTVSVPHDQGNHTGQS